MKRLLSVTNPDDIEFTLEVTMTLGEWKSLQAQMGSDAMPSWSLKRDIDSMVLKAREHFYPDEEGGR